MKRILILLSVFGLLLGACGGGDDDKSNASEDDTSATTKADETGGDTGKDGDLKGKLLTVDDVPSGFKLSSSDEKVPSTSEEDSDFCPELGSMAKNYAGEREATANFVRGDASRPDQGANINERIKRYKDSDQADDAFAAFEEAITKCKSFSQTDEDSGATTEGKFEKIEFPKLGDDTYASQLTIKQSVSTGQAFAAMGNMVAIRSGKYVVMLSTVGFGDEVTKAELESVAKKAVAKV